MLTLSNATSGREGHRFLSAPGAHMTLGLWVREDRLTPRRLARALALVLRYQHRAAARWIEIVSAIHSGGGCAHYNSATGLPVEVQVARDLGEKLSVRQLPLVRRAEEARRRLRGPQASELLSRPAPETYAMPEHGAAYAHLQERRGFCSGVGRILTIALVDMLIEHLPPPSQILPHPTVHLVRVEGVHFVFCTEAHVAMRWKLACGPILDLPVTEV